MQSLSAYKFNIGYSRTLCLISFAHVGVERQTYKYIHSYTNTYTFQETRHTHNRPLARCACMPGLKNNKKNPDDISSSVPCEDLAK